MPKNARQKNLGEACFEVERPEEVLSRVFGRKLRRELALLWGCEVVRAELATTLQTFSESRS